MTTRFIVVRHGETRWNVESRVQGQQDSPLTRAGLEQADAIAARLAEERFDLLVSSDLGRAMQTAQRIAERCGHRAVPDARLRERHFGAGEGLTYGELDYHWPDCFSRVREVDPDFVIPSGESRRQFQHRVAQAFEALALEHDGKRVAVVTHGGVLAALYRLIQGIPVAKPQRIPIANASYNAVTFEADAWAIETWDDVAHLPAAGPLVES